MSAVKKGQVWLDLDGRPPNRALRVQMVGTTHATCAVLVNGSPTGRRTRIRLDRFKPGARGYELLEAVGLGDTSHAE